MARESYFIARQRDKLASLDASTAHLPALNRGPLIISGVISQDNSRQGKFKPALTIFATAMTQYYILQHLRARYY